jgi:hypothetical protein
MEEDPTQAYNQDDATGFIRLNALRLKVDARVHGAKPAAKKSRPKYSGPHSGGAPSLQEPVLECGDLAPLFPGAGPTALLQLTR